MDADLLVKVGVILAILAALWVLPDWGAYRARALRVARALQLAAPEPPRPTGPPIERLAADARRIRAEIRRAPSGIPVAKMRGWLEAYDDVLMTACHTLELEQRLGTLPEGSEHDMERERVERMLERHGLPLRSTA
ncbi:MAG: hypothetical protein ABWZ91_07985 [Nocardioides sp.]|jgi:hypothetical protein